MPMARLAAFYHQKQPPGFSRPSLPSAVFGEVATPSGLGRSEIQPNGDGVLASSWQCLQNQSEVQREFEEFDGAQIMSYP
jgi:hypothetical protein